MEGSVVFNQSVGFQEKHTVTTLHQNQMRLPRPWADTDLTWTFFQHKRYMKNS